MLKAREILRLKHQAGLSLREIGKDYSCCKPTSTNNSRASTPEPDMEYIFFALNKKSITCMLPWKEYKKYAGVRIYASIEKTNKKI